MASNGKSRNKKDPYPYKIKNTKKKRSRKVKEKKKSSHIHNIQIACRMGKLKINVKRHYGSDHNPANNTISLFIHIKLPSRVL